MAIAVTSRLITLVVRIAQAIVCLIVIGLTVGFIKFSMGKNAPISQVAPFFYNVGMAALALLFAIIWALPFSSNFQNWGVDVGVAIVWAGALAWLWIVRNRFCGGKPIPEDLQAFWNKAKDSTNNDIFADNYCSKLQINNVFVIIGILLLFVTAIVSCCALKKIGGGGGGKGGKGGKKGGRRRR